MHFDAMYSRAAARIARKPRADLFLYSPTRCRLRRTHEHRPLKVLFQFHPHPRLERSILVADAEALAREGPTFSDRIVSEEHSAAQPDYDQGWVHQGSHHLRELVHEESLTDVGAPRERISVIPYGLDLPAPVSSATDRSRVPCPLRRLGIQRKGLHHLLHAWRAAQFGPGRPGSRW
jgi:hypothetical protein